MQNIDLMNLAGFCRNCLSKWYVAAAEERGVAVDYEAARERVYGMPYGQWKVRHQAEASAEQQAAFQGRQAADGLTPPPSRRRRADRDGGRTRGAGPASELA